MGAHSEKVLLLAPEQISYWLKLYDCRFESLHREYVLVKNADLVSIVIIRRMKKVQMIAIVLD